MTRHISRRLRLESFTAIYKEEEVLKGDNMVEEMFFLKEEEETEDER
jgi:hypothetical protein